jgi:hypothetical protein
MSSVWAATSMGVVTAVEKDRFTIKAEYEGKELTFKFGKEVLKQNVNPRIRRFPGTITADQLKKGLRVVVEYRKEGEEYICTEILLDDEVLGPREIDFSPMLVDGSLPHCTVYLEVKERRGAHYKIGVEFSNGTPLTEVRDTFKRTLDSQEWTTKAVGRTGLLVVSHSKGPINYCTAKAMGLSEKHQPTVKVVDPPK